MPASTVIVPTENAPATRWSDARALGVFRW